MNLYIVFVQDEDETLLLIRAIDEDHVRKVMSYHTSANYHIRGIVGTSSVDPFDDIFYVDLAKLTMLTK